ncbi:ABC transporter permease [Gracilibacillus alcaliphilus]|uniref:ABC transporter permease n=1 Tax=Gracilibacillus alcaliphilus TaxID=1401441 RepID=UPI001959147C|nr:ABC transporter permease [Gracilibacillus alcaliphilus]MBM7675278.1 hypothetical protein [Gracilibacillus alcaliphilus]
MLTMEWKKSKRTGFIPSFLGGALLTGLIPILYMAFISEIDTNLDINPLHVLLDANWQMMAMLKVSLIVVGACLLYYVESSDNALQKMQSLPIKDENLFFAKFLLISLIYLGVLVMEAIGLGFSSVFWFLEYPDLPMELVKNIGYMFMLSLPAIVLALLIASFFTNIWIALGLGMIGIFLATQLSNQNVILASFPFNLPFQTMHGTDAAAPDTLIWVALIETVVLLVIQKVSVSMRRYFR